MSQSMHHIMTLGCGAHGVSSTGSSPVHSHRPLRLLPPHPDTGELPEDTSTAGSGCSAAHHHPRRVPAKGLGEYEHHEQLSIIRSRYLHTARYRHVVIQSRTMLLFSITVPPAPPPPNQHDSIHKDVGRGHHNTSFCPVLSLSPPPSSCLGQPRSKKLKAIILRTSARVTWLCVISWICTAVNVIVFVKERQMRTVLFARSSNQNGRRVTRRGGRTRGQSRHRRCAIRLYGQQGARHHV